MKDYGNKNESNMIFNIFKVIKFKIPDRIQSIVEKPQSSKVFVLKKKKIINRKLTLNEIIKSGYRVGRWENDEHDKFIQSCMNHKNNWRKIQLDVVTRTPAQIRSHAQKYVIKLCKKYGIKMKNQKESKGEDNNFKIGIVPGSRVKKTSANEDDLKFLKCFDYYRRNLIIEEEDDAESGQNLESPKKIANSDNIVIPEQKKISPPRKIITKKCKIKFIKKINNNKNYNNNSSSNKKEFFKIQKKKLLKPLDEYQQELMNIVNENQQFMNIYIKNQEIQETVKSLFEFLNNKSYLQEVQNIMGLFDLQNFIDSMENSLKFWSQVEVDDVNYQYQ